MRAGEKRAHQLEALLLETGDDLGDEAALDAVRLDHDEGALAGHCFASCQC
jgi:hypothetical protein